MPEGAPQKLFQNKFHLVYDKPMICYPLSVLMLARIEGSIDPSVEIQKLWLAFELGEWNVLFWISEGITRLLSGCMNFAVFHVMRKTNQDYLCMISQPDEGTHLIT